MKITIPEEKINRIIKSHKPLIIAVVLLFTIIFFLGIYAANANKLNWGMKIAGISVGGMHLTEAKELLNSKFQLFLDKEVSLNYKNSTWKIDFKKMGIEVGAQETTERAFELGHQKNIIKNCWWQIKFLLRYNLSPIWQIDEEKLENFFLKNMSSVHQPAQNSTLLYDKEKNEFIVRPSKKGTVVNKEKFKKQIESDINNLENKDIEIFLIEEKPTVIESETEKAKIEAQKILKNLPITLVVTDNEEKKEIDRIDKDILFSIMDFEPVLDSKKPKNEILGIVFEEEKTEAYLTSLSPLIAREPIDARLTVKNNKVIAFTLSQDGLKLEIKNNISDLIRGISKGQKEIQLKTETIKPKITTENIDNLGITALLAKGVSNFAGSPQNRIHNIKVGASRFNGILIKPSEKFSFNESLGEVGPEQGYEPELVIKKDKTIPEYGGGLCQVSTTLFRGIIYAGLEIVERFPHAFPVKYYSPQGFDATIYPPHPDLRFINNTSNNILLQTKINNYELAFELYGTKDGRKVEIIGPEQYDIQKDGSMKAKITQKVTDKNGNIIIDKTFYSAYKSPDLYPVERNPLE